MRVRGFLEAGAELRDDQTPVVGEGVFGVQDEDRRIGEVEDLDGGHGCLTSSTGR